MSHMILPEPRETYYLSIHVFLLPRYRSRKRRLYPAFYTDRSLTSRAGNGRRHGMSGFTVFGARIKGDALWIKYF